MVVTILGLILHLTQTIGYFSFTPINPTPTMIVLDLIGFVLPSGLLLAVSTYRFILIEDFSFQQFSMTFNLVA